MVFIEIIYECLKTLLIITFSILNIFHIKLHGDVQFQLTFNLLCYKKKSFKSKHESILQNVTKANICYDNQVVTEQVKHGLYFLNLMANCISFCFKLAELAALCY